MTKKRTGLVDIPLKNIEDDKLQMSSFEMALSEFISFTSTPITIALQGEWGSGKTSLMNRLDEKLCKNEDAEFYGIWLNTWHFALQSKSENILEEIISSLIEKVVEISKKEHPEKLKNLINDVYNIGKNIFSGLSKIAIKTAVSQVSDKAAETIDETFFKNNDEKKYSLKDLRDKLSELINENIAKNEEKGVKNRAFLFFIDDLDRIEPQIAVKILEMMKNIFDIENCIFILAIDYDVVVKGLKDKFGELTEKNEREFRSFFDKIIQLPFQMPVASYVIDNYIKEQLLTVDIIDEKEAENENFMKTIVSLTALSVGTNPRSIKRLINTLSFINLVIKSKNKLEDKESVLLTYEKQMIYALICLQTGFSQIYNLLAYNADIENWSENFAQKYDLSLKNIEVEKTEILSQKWEQILFLFCQKSSYLKKHFFNILNMFKLIQQIADDNKQILANVLPQAVELVSVTNVRADKKPIIEINNIRVLYALNQKLLPELTKKIREPLQIVERKGRMIAKLSYKFDEQKKNNSVSIYVYTSQNNIYLKFGTIVDLFESPKNSEDSFQNFERFGKTELLSEFFNKLENLTQKYYNFSFVDKLKNGLFVKNKVQKFELFFQISTENVEFFYTKKFIDNLSNLIIDYMIIVYEMKKTEWI